VHYRGGLLFSGLLERARELRQRETPAEQFLWELLRNRGLCGFKFRRQHQFGSYIVDFFCSEALLAVEVDGPVHELEIKKVFDIVRDEYLISRGVTVLRFSNAEVLEEIGDVLTQVLLHLER
jgi:type I restriction enzyme R subunit